MEQVYINPAGPRPLHNEAGNQDPVIPPKPIKEPDSDPRRPGHPGTPIKDPRPEKPKRKVNEACAVHAQPTCYQDERPGLSGFKSESADLA